MPSSKLRKKAEAFSRNIQRYELWYEKHKKLYESELNLIYSMGNFRGKSLEVGVGTGRFAHRLRIKFGIDPSIKMLKFAIKRGVKSAVGVGEKLPFKSATFNSILIAITICFVEKPSKVIQESYRVLSPGGELLVAFIDRESSWGKFYIKKDSPFYEIARFFTFKEIKKILLSNGFHIRKAGQTLFLQPGEDEKIEKPKEGFNEGSFLAILAQKPK